MDAVIDKDLSGSAGAGDRADILVITGVERVCVHFWQTQQQALDEVDVATMTRYMQEDISRREHVTQNRCQSGVPGAWRYGDHPHMGLPAALRGETGTHIVHS